MAKTKQELLSEADKLGLNLSVKNTVAEIEAAIKAAEENGETAAEGSDSEEKTAKTEEKFAKAGKRSEKNVREAEIEAERQARKEAGDTTAQDGAVANRRGPAPKTRPRAERHGKNYRAKAAKIDREKTYSLEDGLKLALETATTKFDSTVELHVRLGVDPKQADQNVRATVSLPHGTGKTVRVAALVANDDAEAAKKAGADFAGEAEILKMLEKEQLDFDVLIATPQEMAKLGKFARLLGPRGLMPNPKSGTVTTNPAQAVKEAKAGKVEYRVDKQSIVHLGVGKVSFGAEKLAANTKVFFDSLAAAKPTSLKGQYILGASIATTMGPSVKIDPSSL